jgi:hypothetical protein
MDRNGISVVVRSHWKCVADHLAFQKVDWESREVTSAALVHQDETKSRLSRPRGPINLSLSQASKPIRIKFGAILRAGFITSKSLGNRKVASWPRHHGRRCQTSWDGEAVC